MPSAWPVLTRYDSDHLARIALPLGGIGTGTVSLGGRGDLRDWEVMNKPAKGYTPRHCFFALWAKPSGGPAVTRALEGALQPPFEGGFGSTVPNHGLPRFRDCRFLAAYPFGQVELSDADVPLSVTMQAFNPLVPGDVEASSIPMAVIRFVLRNRSAKPVRASVCGTMENIVGYETNVAKQKGSVNEYRAGDGVRGVFMRSDGVDRAAEQWGTMALSTPTAGSASHRTGWANLSWGDSMLDFWDDFSADGQLEQRDGGGVDSQLGSLAVAVTVPARSEREVTFLISWHFPNRMTWSPAQGADGKPLVVPAGACGPAGCAPGQSCANPNWIGNHYTTVYRDAWEVVTRTVRELPRLEERTLGFVRAFCASDLPEVVKEAALYNVSTLRSQTCFRTPDGRFYGWEGCGDTSGCCNGSCTHVWNYEQCTAFLFGELTRSMREVEFGHMTRDDGHMSFRVNLPIARAQEFGIAAADGQMGSIMRFHRDWRLCGDERFLRAHWPRVRKALEFCWIPGGWDADRDGVMEGCQHNTMDVEYYGPNPQMEFWYLGALRACEDMARHLGDSAFADECRALFERGSAWTDANLFNGEYYEHEIRPMPETAIAKGLRHNMGAGGSMSPDLQLGSGCLVDQLVGQMQAHICGLGYLGDRRKIAKTLASIHRHNFKRGLYGHFNHLRSFALSDEHALLMATYPRGRRPKRPFPYYNEVMTGFEHTAAVGMIQEGLADEGLECIAAVRARYDGARRSPFDEAECGHHYARAMVAWAGVLALTGFHYSAVEGAMTFRAAPSGTRDFWSTGDAWGTCSQKRSGRGITVTLRVLHGELGLARIVLADVGEAAFAPTKRLRAGQSLAVVVPVRATRAPAKRGSGSVRAPSVRR